MPKIFRPVTSRQIFSYLSHHEKRILSLTHRDFEFQKQPPELFCTKGVLRNFTKFAGKYMCQSLFFSKVADLRPATLLKKRLRHRCFPVSFVKFLRTPFVQNTSERLLLEFENEKQFQVVKKYSKIICNWSFFQKDTLNYLIERFEKLKVDKMFCIPDLLIKDTIAY